MQFHKLANNLQVTNAICLAPTSGTQTGTSIDTLGYRRAFFVFTCNTGAATTITYTLKDSADNSSFGAAIAAAAPAAVLASTTETTFVLDIDLSKRNRYLRFDLVGTGTAGFATGTLLLGQPEVDLQISQEQTALSI